MNQKITVESTFGDGPDVLVSGESAVIILMEDRDMRGFTHGTVSKWQLDLTADEALELSHTLFMAATQTKQLHELCVYHDETTDALDDGLVR
jgi:hypothetical protein